MQIQQMRSLQGRSKDFGGKYKRRIQMVRKQKDKQPERKQIGVKIDSALWTKIKILALEEGRTAGALLENAMKLYLEESK